MSRYQWKRGEVRYYRVYPGGCCFCMRDNTEGRRSSKCRLNMAVGDDYNNYFVDAIKNAQP